MSVEPMHNNFWGQNEKEKTTRSLFMNGIKKWRSKLHKKKKTRNNTIIISRRKKRKENLFPEKKIWIANRSEEVNPT